MPYSSGVERALKAAQLAHAGQTRKGDPTKPYAVHPTHVALLLARLGADDAVLQAALLHDVVEDCEGWTVERVAAEFGERVGAIVAEVSEDKALSWEERKREAIRRAPRLSAEAAAVQAADKLHNLASLREQLELAADPAVVWARFKGGR
ncbi:MAG TPA: HD domain-containing protein, partial [Planctomycetota bacterium]|nr:HD domain-containing protein [Planctomycetota bacterium]